MTDLRKASDLRPLERRQVSNEVLAFQISSLQESVTGYQALLREQMRDGFADVASRLDKHESSIQSIREDLIRIDGRLTPLEAFKKEADDKELEETKRNVLELTQAKAGELDDRIRKYPIGVSVGGLTLLATVLGILAALGVLSS